MKLGTLPPIEVTRAAAEVSARKEDLLISETNLAQQETVLKNALSRNGVESVWLDQVHIIPLDSFEIPKTDELKPTAELVAEALENRPEITQTKINLESSKINVQGTKNNLLPTLSAFADMNNQGLTGMPNPFYPLDCRRASTLSVTMAICWGRLSGAISRTTRRDSPSAFPCETGRRKPITPWIN